ncbi:MAG TPA: glycine betaine ABC transporter substrate-binding protein [Bacteriovoracaceae bacterium]|nr:glycine betaine ABC transporter substrate-binding protein [Bacteriovoracaceae bacterium]
MKLLLIVSLLLPTLVFGQTLRIGGKNFTEQILLASMTGQYLKHQGFNVDVKTGLGTLLMRKALEEDQLDIVWDYTGTALIVYHHVKEKMTGRASYELAKKLDAPKDLIWLEPSRLDNGYALTMPRGVSEKLSIKSIDDLARYIKKEHKEDPRKKNLLAVDFEFASRPDGLKPLQETYEFSFKRNEIKQMDPGLVYMALKNQQVLVGLAFPSDGRISGFNLVVLEDNRQFFPSYFVTAVVRKKVLDKHPKLATYLNNIAAKLDTPTMTELNRRVDIDHESIEKVARDFLKQQGLLP